MLDQVGSRARIGYQVAQGPKGLQRGMVRFFESYKLKFSFARATLSMVIAPQEFQWILKDPKKEPPANSMALETLKREILAGTMEWVRNGNG